MDVALNLRDFLEDPHRPLYEQVDEAVEIARCAFDWGFAAIYLPQHFISHPTVWPQPLPVLARLIPEAPQVKLVTGILLLPFLNPVDVAEQVATMDHLCKGRFVLGVGLGYRQAELEAFGTNRGERLSRFREALHLLKLLWTGQEVTFEGRHWRVHGARMAVLPVQKPHPPIWIASHSVRATRRAAALGDGCLLGPQAGWSDMARLAALYWEALAEVGTGASGRLGAHRCIAVASDWETAIREARAAGERKAAMYGGWSMQEATTVDLGLGRQRALADWAVVGSPTDCCETLSRLPQESGVTYVGLSFLNLPPGHQARLAYLQRVAEEILQRLP
jgi:alkanesulfonate monooxygenase SsuD/methylene tetrahydromethanopterin reductase-like flavin-dependent oxidoreductase (luciferase family)